MLVSGLLVFRAPPYGPALDVGPSLPAMPNRALTAVLDGQQRLTALNVGLRGSMTWKRPRLWSNNPDAFPKRHLYLNLLWEAGEEEGIEYCFSFRSETEPRQSDGAAGKSAECWFRVGDVLKMDGGPAMVRWLNGRLDQRFVDRAYKTLDRFHSVVRKEHVVAYYEERRQILDDVVQIFIRMNDGGTPPFSLRPAPVDRGGAMEKSRCA